MLNYIALAWIQFWVFGPWSEGGFQQTKPFPSEAWLPRLTDFADAVPGVRRADRPSRARLRARRGRPALAVPRAVPLGLRDPADRRQPARRALRRDRHRPRLIIVFAISGALAGLAGMSEVNGVVHRLQDQISPGYGFTAIISRTSRSSGRVGSSWRRSCSGR